MGEPHTTGDEAGERAERLAQIDALLESSKHIAFKEKADVTCLSGLRFLRAELERVTAESGMHERNLIAQSKIYDGHVVKHLAVERELREGLDTALADLKRVEAERDEMVEQVNRAIAWLDRAPVHWRKYTIDLNAGPIELQLDQAIASRNAWAEKAADHLKAWERAMDRGDAALAQVKTLMDGMELAWGIIANVNGGRIEDEKPEWFAAAIRWRDEHWHPALRRHVPLSATNPIGAIENPIDATKGPVGT